MKRFIHASMIDEFNIDIVVHFEVIQDMIAASEIRPILQEDGSIDDVALSEYLEFITEVLLELDDMGLEIIDYNDSKSSDTSKYYTLADREQYETDTMKYIIYLRISDYVPKLTKEQIDTIKHRRNEFAHRLKVKWKPRYITVNKDTHYSYEEALEDVIKKITDYKKMLNSR